MIIKRTIKKFIKFIKKHFSKVVSITVPTFESELLKNRVAIITGGTSGIGYSIAESFLKNGATVIVTGKNKEKINNAVENLKKNTNAKYDNYVYGIDMDISKIDLIESLFSFLFTLYL